MFRKGAGLRSANGAANRSAAQNEALRVTGWVTTVKSRAALTGQLKAALRAFSRYTLLHQPAHPDIIPHPAVLRIVNPQRFRRAART